VDSFRRGKAHLAEEEEEGERDELPPMKKQ
jgi:hypothetical protein